jgi:TRAP-type uncharacterized transport system fused permease subunit
MSITSFFLIGVHSLIAWVLVEVFVNTSHKLKRRSYMAFHYLVIVAAFMAVFWLYFAFFNTTPVFWTTITACAFILVLEWIVFRYLYSGDRWFLNWCDWIFPVFLAASSIYLMGIIV